MRPPCSRCGTPLGSADTSCPACGAPAGPVAPPWAAVGRRPLLDPAPPADPPPVPAPPPTSTWRAGPTPRTGRPAKDGGGRGPVAVGTVTGEVSCERVAASGPGRRVVVQAAAVVAVVALLVAVLADRGLPGAVVLVAGTVPALLQALVLALRPRGDRAAGGEHAVEQWRFRVVEPSGREVDCLLPGRLTGEPFRRGDVVEVYGRADRSGTAHVRELVVVADQRPVRGRPDPRVALTRVADAATLALTAICLLAVLISVLG